MPRDMSGKVKHIENAADATISVWKRVYAFELVMDQSHLDQGVKITDHVVVHEPLESGHLRNNVSSVLRRNIHD